MRTFVQAVMIVTYQGCPTPFNVYYYNAIGIVLSPVWLLLRPEQRIQKSEYVYTLVCR